MSGLKYKQALQKHRTIGDFIPFSSLLTTDTVFTRAGDYVRVFQLSGIAFETKDPEELAQKKEHLSTLLRSIGSEHVSLYLHHVRRKKTDRLTSSFTNDFAEALDREYYESFGDYFMLANEIYLSVIYRPFATKTQKLFSRSSDRSLAVLKAEQRKALEEFDELTSQLFAGLSSYTPRLLETFEDGGVLYSETLSFFEFLLTGHWQPVRVPRGQLYQVLGSSWVMVGKDTIELKGAARSRFLRLLDVKDYPTETYAGILDALLYEPYEFIQTQSFCFYPKHEGKKELERQQKQLQNTEDAGASQIEEITFALDQLISGEFLVGSYHYSLAVFGDSVEEVRRHTSQANAVLQSQGFLPQTQLVATDAAFYAQLPGNFRYRPRLAKLTSKNFASLASFHNFPSGKREGNPWGPAVTLLKTQSGQPYYFNFHATNSTEDAFDQKALGNTRIIGQSGAGKTVLLTFLLCQLQKYETNAPQGFTTIFFDKDRGAEICIRALGGEYLSLETGMPSGLNPFHLSPTEDNLLFLERLVTLLVTSDGYQISPTEQNQIASAVRSILRMKRPLQRISSLQQTIPSKSLQACLSKWVGDGSFAWVFDNETDILDFTNVSNYGIDGTSFLDNESVRTPIAYYLLHRMEEVIDGRRFVYLMDEFWKWLKSPAFSDFAFNKQKTIRKQNGFGVFATQSPSDVLSSEIARTIVEQCATEIYLPNPKADYDDYVKGFKLTETEYQVVRSLGEESRLFLIKQGHQSSIASLNLGGMDDALSILSGSTDNVALLHTVMSEVGSRPSAWIPAFHQRRRMRIGSS